MPNFAELKAEEVTNTTTSTSQQVATTVTLFCPQHHAPLWTNDCTFTMILMTI